MIVCQLFFIALSLIFSSDKHLNQIVFIIENYTQKNVVLNICLFDVLAYHSQRDKQTE